MKFVNKAKNILTNKLLVAGVALTSSSAFAEVPEEITTAITNGKAMVGATTSGLLAMGALGFGIGMVLTWLARR